MQLVQEALAQQKEELTGDIFWVVYDRESEQKYPDALHAEAFQKAGKKIKIALSNVCFEVWILLHYPAASVAPYVDYDDLYERELRKYCHGYDKSKLYEYSDVDIATARQRAIRTNKQTVAGADSSWKKSYQWNPYTNVYELLDAIDEFGKQHATTP